jgi:hypothetical protein
VPRSCANCRAPSCSRTTTPAPSSPARRLGPPVASLIRGIDRAQIDRLHHVHQKPRQMLFPVANLAAKEPTATPGSDRRSKISFPVHHLKLMLPKEIFCWAPESIPNTLKRVTCTG